MPGSWLKGRRAADAPFAGRAAASFAAPSPGTGENDDFQTIITALSHWALLYDVPFHYLLPDERLLPENSIRFFHLDSNWVRAMLDGALSIGRDARVDFLHDALFIDEIYSNSLRSATAIRPMRQGKAARTLDFDMCSGFIMRSPIVAGWRGLDFEALGPDGRKLDAIRIETMSHDVLLGMYIGDIARLTIYEPPEGLHNEAISDSQGRRYIFRRDSSGIAGDATADIDIKPRTGCPDAGPSRVADIRKLKQALGCQNSAELALQLVKLPSYATFFTEDKG